MKSKGSETRQRIIEQSLQLFSVKGYFHTSIHDIQAVTGLTKGGLYAHFKSKEELWWAVYEEAISVWKKIVFKDVKGIDDPLDRLETVIQNMMCRYLGANVFQGGCFLLNTMVELSGQAPDLSGAVLRGVMGFADLMKSWLQEADQKGLLKPAVDCEEVATFLLAALNGVAALYAATRNPVHWQFTLNQLHSYIRQLRKSQVS